MPSHCDDCLAAFNSGKQGRELQIAVDEAFPKFICEECSISSHSPGPVAPGEEVIFLNIHPIHFDDETGILVPIAFEQLTKNDLSLMRRNFLSQADVRATADALASLGSKPRTVDRCCSIVVDEIRQVVDDEGRVLGVYDTALEAKPYHASVFTRANLLGKAGRRKVRAAAHAVFAGGLIPTAVLMEQLRNDGAGDQLESTDRP